MLISQTYLIAGNSQSISAAIRPRRITAVSTRRMSRNASGEEMGHAGCLPGQRGIVRRPSRTHLAPSEVAADAGQVRWLGHSGMEARIPLPADQAGKRRADGRKICTFAVSTLQQIAQFMSACIVTEVNDASAWAARGTWARKPACIGFAQDDKLGFVILNAVKDLARGGFFGFASE